jgi:hypothetical protein
VLCLKKRKGESRKAVRNYVGAKKARLGDERA